MGDGTKEKIMSNNWEQPSIGIFMTSRNNYSYMDKVWAEKTLVDCDIHNISDDSNEVS